MTEEKKLQELSEEWSYLAKRACIILKYLDELDQLEQPKGRRKLSMAMEAIAELERCLEIEKLQARADKLLAEVERRHALGEIE